MAIAIKSRDEITKMRVAGRLAADVLNMITPKVKAGITTDELNKLCHDYIVDVQNAIPAPPVSATNSRFLETYMTIVEAKIDKTICANKVVTK